MPALAKPELLAPAGDMLRLRTALAYGADAVYLGSSSLNLRARARGFSTRELEQAFVLVREMERRCYFCLNALPRQHDIAEAERQLEWLSSLQVRPHGLIVADPGVVRHARRILPRMPLHLSTQANTSNAESVAFWKDQGVARVNLARELRASEIRDIARAVRGVELEVFVHGAMCMALSGRCLMSAHLTGRSANLGLCAHPCRYDYRDASTTAASMSVEERTRPGRVLWDIVEQDGFTEVLSAEDLCLVRHLRWFARCGIAAVKIEGRTKTAGYLAQVVDVYRTALDHMESVAGPGPDSSLLLRELINTATRPLSTGFFHGRKHPSPVILALPPEDSQRSPVLALVGEQLAPGAWQVLVRGRWDASLPCQVLVPGLGRPVIPPGDYGLEDEDGARVTLAHSGTTRILRTDRPEIASGLFLRSPLAG